ncbi:hypothetical protein [Parasitella parasitica]|uniref:Uncharacterized protein n=1 Tax=Parasitella parasitica TaxID=35722 RepID=A0A0B7NU42_9FUNG|nr:hypothetical protein [Parasitella parasitica]
MLQTIPKNHQEVSGASATAQKKKPLPQIPNRSHLDQKHRNSTSIVPVPSWTTTAEQVDSSQTMYPDSIQNYATHPSIDYQNYQPYYYYNSYNNQWLYQYNVIDSNQEWKASFKGPVSTVNRSDSLKIESCSVSSLYHKSGKLPLEPHFEKPHEQTTESQQVCDNNTFLHRKISKEQVYSINAAAPTSLLLQKLNEFSNRAANLANSEENAIFSFEDTQDENSYAASTVSGSGSSLSSSSSVNCESNPPEALSKAFYEPPNTFARSSTTCNSLKPGTMRLQRHSTSMPLLTTQDRFSETQQLKDEEDASCSFYAAERYFDQPASASSVSTPRIPSPWGTSSSKCAFSVIASDDHNKDTVSRISTGSVPNLAIYTAQVPDRISLESSIANEAPETNMSTAEQQFKTSDIVLSAVPTANLQEFFQGPSPGKYSLSIASCSLVTIRSNIKLYRRMAIKTGNRDTQLSYAKYLLQISKLYDKHNTSKPVSMATNDANLTASNKKRLQETPAQTRHRLLSEAGYWIERLAKAGEPEALFIQGRWYLLGPQAEDCVLKEYEKVQDAKAFRCFVKASKSGWTEAHYELAHLWKRRGNFAKAVQCYERGAREQHTLSIYKMAKILLRGQLKKKKDLIRGMDYLKQAADMNDSACAEPAFVLGCIYANEFERIGIQRYVDEGVKTPICDTKEKANNSLALEYLKKSAYYGYPDAIYFMGQVSEKGMLGQLPDAWLAYQHYVRAADVDHAGAMLDLSRIYCQGISGLLAIQKDIAFKWCKRSADLGFDQAEYVLGKYYEDGIGVTPDFPRALEYFGKAAAKGYPLAAEKLNRPMADALQRRPSTCAGRRFIPPVVSLPMVNQDDDDDNDEDDNYNIARQKANANNGNNICTIQ